jgi:hypothetical protein
MPPKLEDENIARWCRLLPVGQSERFLSPLRVFRQPIEIRTKFAVSAQMVAQCASAIVMYSLDDRPNLRGRRQVLGEALKRSRLLSGRLSNGSSSGSSLISQANRTGIRFARS